MSSSSPPNHLSGERDWTSLPPELLHHISEYLRPLTDFIRFHSVCPNWRASATHPPPQLPWLLIDSRIPYFTCDPPETGDLQFYSLLTTKVHHVMVSEAKGRLLHGPGNHYIPTATDSNNNHNYLLNPLTSNRISLPVISSESGDLWFRPFPFYNTEYVGCFLNVEPSGMLIARRVTETNWRTFHFPCGGEAHTFYKGKYYIYDENYEDLMVVDMDNGSIDTIPVLPPDQEDDDELIYLIESSGELLRVSQRRDGFNVYSIDLACQKPQWIKKNSIGDAILFVDSFNGFSLGAHDFPGFSGNCIYFMERGYFSDDTHDHLTLRKYYLEDGRTEVLTGPILRNATWFVPSL